MDAHFRAFSFVDRITSVEEGRCIRGRYTIPAALEDFPLSLAGEAVGQLAAWAAMAAVQFEHRPVAGLAGSVELFATPQPGQILDLAAELEHVDAESVQYSGAAHRDGELMIRLRDCVGPMVRQADFDDLWALRTRFAELCRNGAHPGGFPGLPRLALERTTGEPGRRVSGTFQVPSTAPLFADHFPRRPVFPGSLLMHLNLQLGAILASEIDKPPRGRWTPGIILDMKLRSFIPPGATLRLDALLKQRTDDSVAIALETRADKEVIATSSLVLKVQEGA
jgi:3-hydroxymyristoyl/3-hydroxydecanoyl-(acyl carrier protein) dehydratase